MRLGLSALPSCALALAVLTTGCPDDVENPFESAGSSSSGGADTTTSGDDGGESPTSDTTGSADTMAVDDTDTGAVTDSTSRGDATDDDGDTGTSTGADTGTSESTGTTGDPGQTCPDDSYNTVPQTISDTTADLEDLFDSSCGGSGAPDAAYEFTAPSAGLYRFSTEGSTLDTILYVLDGSCDGTELLCSDDVCNDDTSSAVVVDLAADETVTVVVDSFGLSGNAFTLTIDSCGPPCVEGVESCL